MANDIGDFTLQPLHGDGYQIAFEASKEDYYSAPMTMFDAIKHRSQCAPHLLLGHFTDDNKLLCYITASQSDKAEFTADCVTNHIPGGDTVILHRIWVHKDYRKQGIARKLFHKFKAAVLSLNPQLKRICLSSAHCHVSLFTKLGFTLKGGTLKVPFYEDNEDWIRMECNLEHES